MDPMLGMIMLWGGQRIPYGWAACNGQLLAVSSYQALFSLLGIRYGGDGSKNFGLPNLQGRMVVGYGASPEDGKTFALGAHGGTRQCVLTGASLPLHNHTATSQITGTPTITTTINATQNPATSSIPLPGMQLAATDDSSGMTGAPAMYATPGGMQVPLAGISTTGSGTFGATVTINNSGASAAFNPTPPYQVLTYIIATTGLYPDFQ
jgi:microcystin-dependent protein